MPSYQLTRAASDDLVAVYLYGLERFGPAQADGYHDGLEATLNFLVEYPRAAREREEIRSPVRIYPYKAHLIVYELGPNDNVLILRVRHAREDWLSEMDEA